MPDYYEPPNEILQPFLDWMESYEISMLRQTALALESGLSGVEKNVYLEAFILHARNLYDFFAKERPLKNRKKPDEQDDTVCARHYLGGWPLQRARENTVLKAYFGRGRPANTKAFHLSARRLLEPKTGWTTGIWPELESMWNDFLAQVQAQPMRDGQL